MSYCVQVIQREGYPHTAAFDELAVSLTGALRDMGMHGHERTILFGAHLKGADVRPNDIIYQTEVAGSPWFNSSYLRLLASHEVWDYSAENIRWLAQHSIHARLCPIGYHSSLERSLERLAQQQAERLTFIQDIDVLFYGSMTPRREPIWKAIGEAGRENGGPGLECVHLFGVYGEARDAFMARSKIILNLHAYSKSPFEWVRASYAVANHKFLLSEGEDAPIGACAPVARLPFVCQEWAASPATRKIVADIAYDKFRAMPQTEYLRPLVEQRKAA